jgi:hypothetical protein
MNDEWRLRVDVREEGRARKLTDRLEARELEHDLRTSLHDRVVVSRDGPEVFCYAGTRDQAEAAERAIRSLADRHDWHLDSQLQRWHPTAEEWEDPDTPLPQTDAERSAEHAELISDERLQSQEQGYADFEVRVRCPSQSDAQQLAQRLGAEGIPTVQRWEFVVLGAADEDSANALAERVRAEAPAASTVTAEGSASKTVSDSPLATPFSPFSVFGGLGG